MISLFLSTATKKIVYTIIKDNKVIYGNICDNDNNLSARIMPIIDLGLKETNIKLNSIDNIYIVTGPGSFTGIRIGVTVAKVIAWSLKKRIVPISSLEMLASTNCKTKYIVPLIDARRDYVYGGMYDTQLNPIINDCHILLSDLLEKINNNDVTYVSEDDFDFDTIYSEYNVLNLIEKHKNDEGINPHLVNPNYLKLTEAEENFNKKNDN